ncbi:hypothetical protein F4781DRAFT_402532 [Annulohypoxylon bovei var. microspora]|nr:hypothetical protein F4781DRAFT_402532 [Annulohypoxylon bovei var. microspora]
MCKRRRVFYACFHEDYDVTPPRAILYCNQAKAIASEGGSSDDSNVQPCAAASTLPLTATADFYAGIVRSVPCEACAAQGVRPRLENPSQSVITPRQAAGASGDETGSRHDNPGVNPLIAMLEDIVRLHAETDVFDFDWDEDNHPLSDPLRVADDPTDGGQSSGTSGSASGSFYSDAETEFDGAGQDFQLYDGEDEFADELKEIGSKNGEPPSSKKH